MDDLPDDHDEPCTAGWEAITDALKVIYPKQEPRHWGTVVRYCFGGPDPLDGVSAYWHHDGKSAAHWHYVGFGMSELYGKENEDPHVSGWGFEFTFRLAAGPSDAPLWPASLLQNLARYVVDSGIEFSAGHYLPLNGPIAQGRQTAIHAAVFAEDPELSTIYTPNGKVRPLLLVGLTIDELAAARAWNSEKLIQLMREKNPLLVTDLARTSMLQDPDFLRRVTEGTALDGSSSGSLFVPVLNIETPRGLFKRTLVVTIGALSVDDFRALLRGRIGFERPFTISSRGCSLNIMPARDFKWKMDDAKRQVALEMPAAAARCLADTLQPVRGEYQVSELEGLTIRVIPTEIKDHSGKRVISVIG